MSEFITTYTGKHFKPTDPNPELIGIPDIAHALSLICRGNGHVKTFWSVGQHCICCAKEAAARGLSDRMVLACLLHDASECYMSDVPSPFKKTLPEYQEQEAYLLHLIYEKFLGSDLTAQEQAQLISMEAAQEAALKAANIAAENAAISATTLNEVAGTSCYKVEFTSGDYAYAYTVNAETGAIMEMSSRDKNAVDTQAQTEATAPAAASDTTPAQNSATTQSQSPATASSQTVTGTVNEETAQKIALEHAGVKATDATITKSRLDYEDRRQVYEIEWYAGGKKYDYEIAVDTGEVLSSGYDEKTAGWSGSNSNNVTASEADAKQTALGRVSGATEKDIYEWQFDYDDGRPEYEGKIIYGGTEYDFTIDASNGSVVEWEAESVR